MTRTKRRGKVIKYCRRVRLRNLYEEAMSDQPGETKDDESIELFEVYDEDVNNLFDSNDVARLEESKLCEDSNADEEVKDEEVINVLEGSKDNTDAKQGTEGKHTKVDNNKNGKKD